MRTVFCSGPEVHSPSREPEEKTRGKPVWPMRFTLRQAAPPILK